LREWGFLFLESELFTRALILLEEEEEEEEEKEVGNQNLFSYTDAQRAMNVTAVNWRFRV
jgi:predicted RNA-binding protein (virulence factor B family)